MFHTIAAAILFAAMQVTPITIPNGPLTVSWASSTMTGTGRMGWDGEDVWQFGPQEKAGPYLLLTYSQGVPFFVLNTPGGVVASGRAMTPQDPQRRIGFVVTEAQQTPFMLQFTAATPVGTGWGDNLVVTIHN